MCEFKAESERSEAEQSGRSKRGKNACQAGKLSLHREKKLQGATLPLMRAVGVSAV